MIDIRTCRVAVYAVMKDEALSVPGWIASSGESDYRLVVVDQATADNTAGLLHDAGIHVINVDWHEHGGWRWDVARNYALSHLPDDIDLCCSIDADETLNDGFIDQLRLEWETYGSFDGAMPWEDCGQPGHPAWSRPFRIHARRGYEWVAPCHETLIWRGDHPERRIESAASMTHHQLPKDRSHRIDLLRLGVEENPADARMWHYLSRDSLSAGMPSVALEAAEAALALPTGCAAERAAVCRYAAQADLDRSSEGVWLLRGCIEGPHEAEAWYAYANYCYQQGDWDGTKFAALQGLKCPQATHYLANQDQRSFGLKTLADMADDKMKVS